MMWSAKLCSSGPWQASPTNRLNLTTTSSPEPVTTLNLRAPLSGPSAILASYLDFCSRIVKPLTSRPRFGKTMRRHSSSSSAANCGDTSGLPTQSLNLALTLSMRHSTREMVLPASSLGRTARLSGAKGAGSPRPGGSPIFSVCDLVTAGCLSSGSSGTFGSEENTGAVFVRCWRRAAPPISPARPGGVPGSSKAAGASAALDPGAALLATSSIPIFFLSSRVSVSMSRRSLEIWPRDRSSFWTREPIVCTCATSAGASWHAWAAASEKAPPRPPEKLGIMPPSPMGEADAPAIGDPDSADIGEL
mmetsp:Transcript_59970/g.157717  ORF Transcript_59970/g.157717 Transcript_59970/m.157717 type:complete len:305 (+) Transcript_59970:460-1374(+)